MTSYGMGWGWGFGWISMILFWAVFILAVFTFIKILGSRSKAIPDESAAISKTALDYLDEAYAKGELSREEYLQKREDLMRE